MAKGHGGKRRGAGRKSIKDEQGVKDLISPYRDEVITTVIDILRNGERDSDRLSAAKLLLSYDIGLPKATHELSGKDGEAPIFKVEIIGD